MVWLASPIFDPLRVIISDSHPFRILYMYLVVQVIASHVRQCFAATTNILDQCTTNTHNQCSVCVYMLAGLATGLRSSGVHSRRSREGRELHRLLHGRRQALPDLRRGRPHGQSLGLSGAPASPLPASTQIRYSI